jgi:hypothetical protein
MSKSSQSVKGQSIRWTGFLRRLVGLNAPAAAPQPAPRRDVALPLTALAPSAHWDRVSAVVQQSFARLEAVKGCQALAQQQLDVADYVLQALVDELRAVMPDQFPCQPALSPRGPQYAFANARRPA